MIANLILIVVVLGVAFAIIRRFITKRQNEESDEKMQVDDRTYTLEMMISFVKRRLDEITKINLYDIGLSEEELKRRKNKKYELKKALKGCTYGDVNDKKYIKELIYDMLYNEYGVNERSIQRDVDDIRNYLELEAVNSGCINNVIYDRLNKGYRLEKVQKRSLTDEEIVEICKILLKSQEIDSQEMSKMVEKLISSCVPKNNKKIILELINQK